MELNRNFAGVSAALLLIFSGLAAVRFVAVAAENGPRLRVDSSPLNRSPETGNSYSPIVKTVAPSVVNIYSSRFVKQRYYSPFMSDPFLRHYFGGLDPGREVTSRDNWLGSGIVVTPDGYILTANHVVEGADEIKVGLKNDANIYSAKIIGLDPPTDVAILKIDAKNLPAATLGDSDRLEVGDVVLAVGNPFGIGQTVTRGIISALGRTVADSSERQYQDFIQTDAAINEGNSGGALVDAEGRLIGINDAMISPSGSSAGIGLAVPINLARSVMEGFINGGKVVRGALAGVETQDIDAGLAKGFGAPSADGALVTVVDPDSPAAKAGLQSGDVIVAVNDKDVPSKDKLLVSIAQLQPGTQAKLKIFRNGAVATFAVTLGAGSDTGQEAAPQGDLAAQPPKADALDGVQVQDLNGRIRRQLRAPARLSGALVMKVDRASNSADAGLQPADVIVEINRQPVANSQDAERLCRAARTDQILLKLWRPADGGGKVLFLDVDNTKPAF